MFTWQTKVIGKTSILQERRIWVPNGSSIIKSKQLVEWLWKDEEGGRERGEREGEREGGGREGGRERRSEGGRGEEEGGREGEKEGGRQGGIISIVEQES
jgi:hypothetical protein